MTNYFFPSVAGNRLAVINPSHEELAFVEPSTWAKKVVVKGDMNGVYAISASRDYRTVVTYNLSSVTQTVWHAAEDGKPIAFTLKHLRLMACSPDGKTVAVAVPDSGVRLCDAATQKEVGRCAGNLACGDSFFPDSQTLATLTPDGLTLWNIHSCLPMLILPYPYTVWPKMLAIAPDGQSLATCTSTDGVTVWDCATGQKRAQYCAPNGVGDMFYSLDGSKLAFLTIRHPYAWLGALINRVGYGPTFGWPDRKEAVVLDVASGQELARVPRCDSPVLFTDENTLAVLTKNHTIQLWELPPRQAWRPFLAWSCLGVAFLLTGAWFVAWRTGWRRSNAPSALSP